MNSPDGSKTQRRAQRAQKREERRLTREKTGTSTTTGILFASDLVEVVTKGAHAVVMDILQLVQERQARNRGEALPPKRETKAQAV